MFRDTRRKKLRNQVILAALAVSLMTFGIWLNYKTVVDQDGSEEAARKVLPCPLMHWSRKGASGIYSGIFPWLPTTF